MADQLEGARSLPVKFRDQGDGSVAELLEVKPHRGVAVFSGSHTTSDTPNTSTEVRPLFAGRKDVEMVNISDATIYLGFGGAAVIEAGIPLTPGSGYYSERSTEQITSICAVASKKLTVLER